MADINKCDIEIKMRTAYRLKYGVSWENVESYFCGGICDFEEHFEKVELPVVELRESDSLDGLEINGRGLLMWKVIDRDYSAWGVELEHDRYGISAKAYIGESELLKSIDDFNNMAAMLFGFYLKEPEGAEK